MIDIFTIPLPSPRFSTRAIVFACTREKSAVKNSRQFDVIMHANCSVCDCAHNPHTLLRTSRHMRRQIEAIVYHQLMPMVLDERVQKAVEQSRNCA